MNSLANKYGSIESTLMLFVADELPTAERARVVRELEANPAMRAQLEELQASLDQVNRGLEATETAETPAVDRMVKQLSPVLRQWVVERTAVPDESAALPRLRFPWWSYPAVSAAAIVLALAVFISHQVPEAEPPLMGLESLAVFPPDWSDAMTESQLSEDPVQTAQIAASLIASLSGGHPDRPMMVDAGEELQIIQDVSDQVDGPTPIW